MKSLWRGRIVVVLFSIFITSLPLFEAIAATSSYGIPETIDVSQRYLFYLHGTGVEIGGPNAVNPRLGRMDYHGVVKAFQERGFKVISEVRPKGTIIPKYAEKVVAQVKALLDAGVPPDQITVLGFSKGGIIAFYTSAGLGNPNIKFVVMACCVYKGKFKKIYDDTLKKAAPSIRGRFLSVYDTKDHIGGTCKKAFTKASDGVVNSEIKLKGKGHATFFIPRDVWIDPVVDWINSMKP